ncbi:MAG: sensor histidine kinase N-terminal domain-containing protein [Rhodocyclaceae bacterium]|nr:sensor histidine kinase N-terminal domain-containing protein [Rhodocyclaceae bacterium]MBX3668303.1 sensor histidine kinase N-terminal domain-containing protein [Rhodocyclaceae bacterium]
MNSIRRKLLAALLATLVGALAAGGYGTYRSARGETDKLFDYQLRQIALGLRDQAFGFAVPPAVPDDQDFDFVIQVWDREGLRLYLSRPHSVLPNRAQLGWSTVDTGAATWRVFAMQASGQVIQVAQPMAVREALAARAALHAVAPYILLLPLVGGVVWVIVGRGLAPLARLARAVEAKSPAALVPLAERDAPQEALPLVRALNDLLLRLGAAMDAQRAFIADAAHELRTPLAALQLQAQLLARAADPAQRAEALSELQQGLQRVAHLVQQLLTLAREEPQAPQRTFEPVDLGALAGGAVAELLALAEARGIDLGVAAAAQDALVAGDADALRTLAGCLIDNAVRYTPAGGRVDVSVGRDAAAVWLMVQDSGPGIAPHERERVFDRFYRGADAGAGGSGLGLAIARAIAERHGARIKLGDAPGGGLELRVEFPPAVPAAG